MSKKLLSIFLAIVMVLTIVPLYSFAEDDITSYLTYEINDGEVTITDCDTSISGDIVIPDTIEGYPVTTIAMSAFYLIEESVLYGGSLPITSISIPATVKIIEEDFEFVYGLENFIVDSDNMYYSSDSYGALYNKDKTRLIRYPEDCTATEYTIPSTVTDVDLKAFSGCVKLVSIKVSSSVKHLGYDNINVNIFGTCSNLESIIVDSENKYYSSDLNGVLYNNDKTELISYPRSLTITEYTIPDTVQKIVEGAVLNDYVETVTVSDNITEIGYNGFSFGTGYYNNKNNWDNGVLYVGKYLIDADENITECTIRDDTIMIGPKAFSECHNLKSIVIPGNVKTIGKGAFGDHLESLTQVTISEGVTIIGDSAFYGAPITEIVIPSTVTSIDGQAFNCCTELTDITILSDDIEHIGWWAFRESAYWNDESNWEYGVLYIGKYLVSADDSVVDCIVKDGTILIADCAFEDGYNLKTIELADSVTTIGYKAFYGTRKLEKVVLSKSLKKIDNNPFFNCDSLAYDGIILPDGIEVIPANLYSGISDRLGSFDVVLPESVREIGDNAFYECILLDSISLSENVEYIGVNALTDCVFLDDITLYNKNIVLDKKSIGYSSFVIVGDKAEFEAKYKEILDLMAADEIEKAQTLISQIQPMVVLCDEPQPDPNFTIYGYKGSTAETYANENNLKFVPICKHNYVDTVITPATYSQTGEGGEVCEHCGDVKSTYEIPCLEVEDSIEEEDKDTGVSVIFPDGAFADADVKIEVTPVEEGEAYKLISHKQGNYKVTMFDIEITADGENVQPNGTVLVKIPLPKGYNQNKCVVYYVADDGTMEELKTYHYKDGYVYFETDHFSYYAVVEDEAEESTDFFSMIKKFIEEIKAFFEKVMNILKNLCPVKE